MCWVESLWLRGINDICAHCKTLLQYRWWQLDVLAENHDSSWMWWSEICNVNPKLSKFAELIHDMCTPPVLIWSFCLCPYNHEKINTSSVQSGGGQQSFALKCKSCRGIFDSTGTQHTPFGARNRTRRSQQYGKTHLSAALRHGYRDIPGTGHTRWDIGIIILIILHYSHYSPRNN